jgi:hypothetical protein
MYQLIVGFASDSLLSQSNILFVIKEILVIRTNIEINGNDLSGEISATGHKDIQFGLDHSHASDTGIRSHTAAISDNHQLDTIMWPVVDHTGHLVFVLG